MITREQLRSWVDRLELCVKHLQYEHYPQAAGVIKEMRSLLDWEPDVK